MRWTPHRVENIRRHGTLTPCVSSRASRRSFRNSSPRDPREPAEKPARPPPGKPAASAGYLSAFRVADFPQLCGVGRSFFAYERCPRCRSPPVRFISIGDGYDSADATTDKVR